MKEWYIVVGRGVSYRDALGMHMGDKQTTLERPDTETAFS
jgi:hypothetical protein